MNSFLSYPKLNERSVKSGQYRKRCYEFAVKYAAEHMQSQSNYAFNPINLGDSVNSAESEYYPSVTVTDSLLVFTRLTGHGREDFMESHVTKNGFAQSKLINGDINTEPKKAPSPYRRMANGCFLQVG